MSPQAHYGQTRQMFRFEKNFCISCEVMKPAPEVAVFVCLPVIWLFLNKWSDLFFLPILVFQLFYYEEKKSCGVIGGFILIWMNDCKSFELNFPRITFFSSMAVFCCNTKLVEKTPFGRKNVHTAYWKIGKFRHIQQIYTSKSSIFKRKIFKRPTFRTANRFLVTMFRLPIINQCIKLKDLT